ncbi:class III extradiol ring-cleavage dioxygenase [Rhodoferax sp. GW822-FHT02A01]|uniref:DODA-type extradiol aromatic ring-opening family dioxygenase n=1 Tax=Rhodoferax sp. GW822-FHT02A01 TaxID=3141537 RepID=UPI00315D60A0
MAHTSTQAVKAPVLFISHGAPTFALEPGQLGPRLNALGAQLSNVKAVLVVSPHWQTRGVSVSTDSKPETIHDFGGFPAKLYDLSYPAAGAPHIAERAAQLLSNAGFATKLDPGRGLDHGAWVPLYHLLPQAQIPVFQVSMPYDLSAEQSVQLGRALAPLREEGVLIIASGSMTHNLREFRQGVNQPASYVQEFSDWVKTAVLANALQPVVNYRTEAPHAQRAHPTEEHFLPLLVAMGAQLPGESAQLLEGGIEHGMLSMDSFAWGVPQSAVAPSVAA